MVQNGLITLENVRVPEENHLQAGQSFRDTARVLRMTRYLVAWEATGCQMGAYEHARQVRPGAFAVRQTDRFVPACSGPARQDDRLISRLVSAWWCGTAQLHAGQASWATITRGPLQRRFAPQKMGETVAWAREILGGNGISTDYHVARFFADSEALYSYEGTYQMQNLIVGKAITGLSAFV